MIRFYKRLFLSCSRFGVFCWAIEVKCKEFVQLRNPSFHLFLQGNIVITRKVHAHTHLECPNHVPLNLGEKLVHAEEVPKLYRGFLGVSH